MLKNENQFQATSLDQEIEKIYQDLEKSVDVKIRTFINKKQQEIEKALQKAVPNASPVASQPATISQPKNLPWFSGGIKGFLRKLWHGNSASNPDWQWNTVKESCTLNEYAYIKSEIENILFETDMLDSDDIKTLVTDIMMSVRKAVEDTKMIINKSEKDYSRGQRRLRRTNRDGAWQQVQQPVEEPSVQSSPTVNEPDPPKVEPKTEPAAETEVAPDSTAAPEESRKKRKLGEVGRGKFKSSKAPREKPPELSFDEMKLKQEDAKAIAENLHYVINHKLFGSVTLDKTQKAEKLKIVKQTADMLNEKGIEITNQQWIASTELNAVRLVQIMQELNKIDHNNDWKDADHYHFAFPEMLYKNTYPLIEKAIEMFENKPAEDELTGDKPNYNESLTHYLNNKNKFNIKEKKNLFVNLIKENNQDNVNALKLSKTKGKDKIKLIKSLIKN